MTLRVPNCKNCGKINPPRCEYCCSNCKYKYVKTLAFLEAKCVLCCKSLDSRYKRYCTDCKPVAKNQDSRVYEKINPEKTRELARKSSRRRYHADPKKAAKDRNDWYHANKEKVRESRTSPEGKAKANNYVKNRYRSDPAFCLTFRMRASMQHALKGQKNGRKWEKMVGYSRHDLVRHLERQFVQGMSWDNMGEWQIDHIVPKAHFSYTSEHDPEFKVCWGLTNLRPLWIEANKLKSDKREFLL